MFFFFFPKLVESASAQTHTVTLSGVVTVTRRELYTYVSLCFTLGKVSPHVSSGLYKRDEMVFGGFFFSFFKRQMLIFGP